LEEADKGLGPSWREIIRCLSGFPEGAALELLARALLIKLSHEQIERLRV